MHSQGHVSCWRRIFVPRKTVVAALLGLQWMQWKKKRFACAVDQNIQKIVLKHAFTVQFIKGGHIAKSDVCFHPCWRRPCTAANTVLRGMKIHRQRLMPSTVETRHQIFWMIFSILRKMGRVYILLRSRPRKCLIIWYQLKICLFSC